MCASKSSKKKRRISILSASKFHDKRGQFHFNRGIALHVCGWGLSHENPLQLRSLAVFRSQDQSGLVSHTRVHTCTPRMLVQRLL